MTKTLSQGLGTQDIELNGAGNLAIVNDLEGLRQKVTARLRLFREEWFLDTSRGVPYLQEILRKGAEEGKVAGIIDSEILKENGVTGLRNVSASVDRNTRTFTYAAQVSSIFGEFEVSV